METTLPLFSFPPSLSYRNFSSLILPSSGQLHETQDSAVSSHWELSTVSENVNVHINFVQGILCHMWSWHHFVDPLLKFLWLNVRYPAYYGRRSCLESSKENSV